MRDGRIAILHQKLICQTIAALPRRSTKGPLDAQDPLSVSSPIENLRSPSPGNASNSPLRGPSPALPTVQAEDQPSEEKDFSFLLDGSIYHPLSQLEVPPPFRKSFPPSPTRDTPLSESFKQLELLLAACEFFEAAHLAGSILTSGSLRSSDAQSIFRLLSIRYSCLELSGNLLLAAQESKALEDLSSAFYYDSGTPNKSTTKNVEHEQPLPKHIMPFALRLQALRLQSIGFSDPRRGVSALYELGMECRDHIASSSTSDEEAKLWSLRLEEIGIHVINALIEMGEHECARQTLSNTIPSRPNHRGAWKFRLCLLHLKMGMIPAARDIIDEEDQLLENDKLLLTSLLAVADGRYEDAAEILSNLGSHYDWELAALAKQNLAVAYLYLGDVQKSKDLMETLVDNNQSFQALTVNLATIYDLTSDRAQNLKMVLTDRVAKQESRYRYRAFNNSDFKL